MKILLLEPQNYSTSARRVLGTLGQVTEGPLGRQALLDAIGEYDALVVRLGHRLDRELMALANRLKVIVSPTTGLDHIDLVAARERSITVLSLQGEREFLQTITATAEHTWGLLLALVRCIPTAHASVLKGQWDRDRFKGWQLSGKTLGVVGYGRLGRMVARYGVAFGMNILTHDPYVRETESPVQWVSFEQLLESSEVVSLHLPLNESTAGMFNREALSRMRQGMWVVNTSRGALINEEALLHELESGHLGGAALDVLGKERSCESFPQHPLFSYARSHTNLILTPHVGGCTAESMEHTEVFMAGKLKRWVCEHQTIES